VFDMPGLTFQGSLDRFWLEKSAPNPALFRAFRQVVLRRAQLNGSFFTEAGIALAVEAAVERLGVATLPAAAAAPLRPGKPELAPAKAPVLLGP
jgi:capsular polysaccharide export protein